LRSPAAARHHRPLAARLFLAMMTVPFTPGSATTSYPNTHMMGGLLHWNDEMVKAAVCG
jgi:hypothetical protein